MLVYDLTRYKTKEQIELEKNMQKKRNMQKIITIIFLLFFLANALIGVYITHN